MFIKIKLKRRKIVSAKCSLQIYKNNCILSQHSNIVRFILILFSSKALSTRYLLVILLLLQLLLAFFLGFFQRALLLPHLFTGFARGINGKLFTIYIYR